MTCPSCKTIFVFACPEALAASACAKPTCPACGRSMSFEEAKASHVNVSSEEVAEALGFALEAQKGEAERLASGAPPRRRATPHRIEAMEWRVVNGLPVLFVVPPPESGAQSFALRIPDVDAFKTFILSLMDAGAASFPEIEAEVDWLSSDPATRKPS